jgi:predicted acylesterase/phospholipase RssA/CRP-like cAMP-binding protein
MVMRPSISASGAYATIAAREGELREALTASALFGDSAWEEDLLADVVAQLSPVVVPSGEVVMREGEPSDDLLVVVSGRLRVVRQPAEGEEVVLTEVARGETVGETGLITREPRAATVYAVRDSILARLTRERYDALCRRHPQAMMERFAGGALRRLLQQSRGERQSAGFHGAIALVAADRQVPLDWLVGELTRELGRHGATVVIGEDACDAVLGREGACGEALGAEDEARLARYVADQERAHRFLLYRADRERSHWTARCVRQADVIVVVARAGSSPDAAALAALLTDGGVRRDSSLVLVHDGRTLRAGAGSAWSASEVGADMHHVRRGTEEDIARLARLLAGAGVSLVIGGGGARAFAAVGVARALREAGVPLDAFAGVSAGALVASLFAIGLSHDEVLARSRSARRRVDYTVPVHGLTTGRSWTRSLQDLYGDTQIEDLLLPFFCTSVNLTDGELVVHDRGSLWLAVRASTAIPGMIPPVWHDGDLLVDGGLLNNLPVDLARARRGVGRALAVQVSPRATRRLEPFGAHVSGWKALGARLTHRGVAGLPTAVELLTLSMVVGDAHTKRSNATLADWIFQPPSSHALLDWGRLAEIAESGYCYASEVMQGDEARAAILAPVGASSRQIQVS